MVAANSDDDDVSLQHKILPVHFVCLYICVLAQIASLSLGPFPIMFCPFQRLVEG